MLFPSVCQKYDYYQPKMFLLLHAVICIVLLSMTVVNCDLPEPSVAFSEGTGVSLRVSGLSLVIRGNWNTRFGIM